MEPKLECFVCNRNDELNECNLGSRSSYSGTTIYELIESISGLQLTNNIIPVCSECFDKLNSFDQHFTLAMKIKDELSRMLSKASNAIEVEHIKIEPKDELNDEELIPFYDFQQNFEYQQQPQPDLPPTVPAKTFQCKICPKSFKSTKILNQHIRSVHTDERNFKCEKCQKAFKTRSHLNTHTQLSKSCSSDYDEMTPEVSTSTQQFKCHQCSKVFATQQRLRQHINGFHSTERKFKCELCDKSYKSSSSLGEHVQTHSRSRFICDVCGVKFQYKRTIRVHVLTVHSKQPKNFLCSFCPQVFVNASFLQFHMKTHAERKEICPICGNKFLRKNGLKRHIRSHGTFGEFNCELCNKQFKEKYNRDRHMRDYHERQAPKKESENFTCNICKAKFNKMGLLRQHLARIHYVVFDAGDESNHE